MAICKDIKKTILITKSNIPLIIKETITTKIVAKAKRIYCLRIKL